jgi:ATP-binding cassette subfamily B protein
MAVTADAEDDRPHWPARFAARPRVRLVGLMWDASRPVTIGLALWMFASALLPLALFVAMGWAVERIPAAASEGMDSASGRTLLVALGVTSVLLIASLVVGTVRGALGAVASARLTFSLQHRLIDIISAPAGIAHLEDPTVQDRLALAQGSLLGPSIGGGPGALADVLSTRLQGVFACIAVGVFRWWLGLGLLLVWALNRPSLMRRIQAIGQAFVGEAPILRRSVYLEALADRPDAAKELRVFGFGEWVVQAFRERFLDAWTRIWRIQSRQMVNLALISVQCLVVYAVAYFVLADAALAGSIGLGAVAALVPIIGMTWQVLGLGGPEDTIAFAVAAIGPLDALHAQFADVASEATPRLEGPHPVTAELRFDHVAFAYPHGAAPVFESLDLVLRAGRSTAIVGANGVGKTTLVKLLARLHEPTAGAILLDGRPLSDYDAAAWQRQVAIVFQDYTQYPLSAHDNVTLGAPERAGDLAARDRAARRAGTLERVEALPRGWDTTLSRKFTDGVDLSGGEWQRLALARALFAAENGARILVLDEPTAQLDAHGEADFFDRFLEITTGLTTVIISHRFSTVRRADDIVVIDGGRVVEEGNHDELVARGGHYARAFMLQASRFADDVDADRESA